MIFAVPVGGIVSAFTVVKFNIKGDFLTERQVHYRRIASRSEESVASVGIIITIRISVHGQSMLRRRPCSRHRILVVGVVAIQVTAVPPSELSTSR